MVYQVEYVRSREARLESAGVIDRERRLLEAAHISARSQIINRQYVGQKSAMQRLSLNAKTAEAKPLHHSQPSIMRFSHSMMNAAKEKGS